MSNFDKYSQFIAKHLAGQATPGEEQELFDWMEADPGHQTFFEELAQTWAMTEAAATAPFEVDLPSAWSKVEQGISATEGLGENPPVIVRKIGHRPGRYRAWAAAAAVLLAIGMAYWWTAKQPQATAIVEVRTLDNEKKEITLPDSSHVWLNENSTLAYDPAFADRQVNLKGEAFFKVERMVDRPFEISSCGATTTVLGTSFNVRAYPTEKKVEVTVKTGKVALAVTKRKESPVYITPGESGVFDKEAEKVTVAIQTYENADSWKTLRLSFDDEKMGDVVKTLERYFGVEIEAENPLILECPYTATFEQPDLDAILTIIGSTLGFEFSHQGDKFILKGKGCEPGN